MKFSNQPPLEILDCASVRRIARNQFARIDEAATMERIADVLGSVNQTPRIESSSRRIGSYPPKQIGSSVPQNGFTSRQQDRSADGIHAELSYAINGAAIEVHRHIGPGQYESVYENALCDELRSRGMSCGQQVAITALYKGKPVGKYRADIIVEQKVVIELKSVARISIAHRMQVLTYLRASGLRLGLIMNFNSEVLWREIKRVVL